MAKSERDDRRDADDRLLLARKNAQIEDLSRRIAQLVKDLDASWTSQKPSTASISPKQLKVLKDENQSLAEQVRITKEQNARVRSRNQEMQKQTLELGQQIAELDQQVTSLLQQRKNLRKRLADMESSKSWRITSFLRNSDSGR